MTVSIVYTGRVSFPVSEITNVMGRLKNFKKFLEKPVKKNVKGIVYDYEHGQGEVSIIDGEKPAKIAKTETE
jgi:adenosine/AMP kinase